MGILGLLLLLKKKEILTAAHALAALCVTKLRLGMGSFLWCFLVHCAIVTQKVPNISEKQNKLMLTSF